MQLAYKFHRPMHSGYLRLGSVHSLRLHHTAHYSSCSSRVPNTSMQPWSPDCLQDSRHGSP